MLAPDPSAVGNALAADLDDREIETAATAMRARKNTTAAIIQRFTFVVRRCVFTSGRPLLSLSMDITRLTHRVRFGARWRLINVTRAEIASLRGTAGPGYTP